MDWVPGTEGDRTCEKAWAPKCGKPYRLVDRYAAACDILLLADDVAVQDWTIIPLSSSPTYMVTLVYIVHHRSMYMWYSIDLTGKGLMHAMGQTNNLVQTCKQQSDIGQNSTTNSPWQINDTDHPWVIPCLINTASAMTMHNKFYVYKRSWSALLLCKVSLSETL